MNVNAWPRNSSTNTNSNKQKQQQQKKTPQPNILNAQNNLIWVFFLLRYYF